MIRRTIREYEKISYGTCNRTIPEWAADRLARVAAASPLAGASGTTVLFHGRRDLKAGHVVGVVAAQDCALEILPKIDGLGEGDECERNVRNRLIHMLAIAHDIRIDGGAVTALDTQRDNLLEVLIGLFARKLAEGVRKGMPRRYVDCEEDLPALRGRLDVVQQFTRLAANPARLACRFDTLSPDISLNRAMKAAVTRMLAVSRSTANRRLLTQLAFDYSDVATVPVKTIVWKEIVLDRTSERWRELLRLAELLLGGRYQTTSGGEAAGFSLLFPMHTLFEAYAGRLLAKGLASSGYRVALQSGRRSCLIDGDGNHRFQTRPDIIVWRGGQPVFVIDTKWKRVSSRIEDPKQGVSQADVYQMIAYGRLYECPHLMLLYPHHLGIGTRPLHDHYRVAGCGDTLSVATLDLAEGTARNMADLAALLLGETTDTPSPVLPQPCH